MTPTRSICDEGKRVTAPEDVENDQERCSAQDAISDLFAIDVPLQRNPRQKRDQQGYGGPEHPAVVGSHNVHRAVHREPQGNGHQEVAREGDQNSRAMSRRSARQVGAEVHAPLCATCGGGVDPSAHAAMSERICR
jgi:hypothetical protein